MKNLLRVLLWLTLWHPVSGWAEDFTIADGSRVTVDDKGISMVPPVGWEVYRSMPNITLFMQVPKDKNLKYQRNISVRFGHDPMAIDELTAEDYAKKIISARARLFANMSEYRLRNYQIVDLQSGDKGLLFYTEFKFNDEPMMEMHLLVSSQTGNFLLTYTDLAEYFAGAQTSPELEAAYGSLTSVQLTSRAPERFGAVWKIMGALAFLLLVTGILRVSYGRMSLREESEFNDIPETDDTSSSGSAIEKTSDLEYMAVTAEVDSMHGSKNNRASKRAKANKKRRNAAMEDDEADFDEMDFDDDEAVS